MGRAKSDPQMATNRGGQLRGLPGPPRASVARSPALCRNRHRTGLPLFPRVVLLRLPDRLFALRAGVARMPDDRGSAERGVPPRRVRRPGRALHVGRGPRLGPVRHRARRYPTPRGGLERRHKPAQAKDQHMSIRSINGIRVIAILSLGALTGCGGSVGQSEFERLKVGMTSQEVERVLGKGGKEISQEEVADLIKQALTPRAGPDGKAPANAPKLELPDLSSAKGVRWGDDKRSITVIYMGDRASRIFKRGF